MIEQLVIRRKRAHAAVAVAGCVAIGVAWLVGLFTVPFLVVSVAVLSVAHLLAWEVNPSHRGRTEWTATVATQLIMPVLIVVGAVAFFTPWPWSPVACVWIAILVAQATVSHTRVAMMVNLAFTGVLLVMCSLASNQPGVGWFLVAGWVVLLVAGAVVQSCQESAAQFASASLSTATPASIGTLTHLAPLVVGAGAIALGLLLVLPTNLGFLLDLPRPSVPMSESQPPPDVPDFHVSIPEYLLRLIVVAIVVVSAIALIWYLRDWRPRLRKRRRDADLDAATDLLEPLAAFGRLDGTLRATQQARATSEAPLELSTRLPGSPDRALRTVEETCYAAHTPDERTRLAAAAALDRTGESVQRKYDHASIARRVRRFIRR